MVILFVICFDNINHTMQSCGSREHIHAGWIWETKINDMMSDINLHWLNTLIDHKGKFVYPEISPDRAKKRESKSTKANGIRVIDPRYFYNNNIYV